MSDNAPLPRRDRQARVHVDDETWQLFRFHGSPVSRTLGELVERQVRRYRARELQCGGEPDAARLAGYLEEARELRDSLEAIVSRLEAAEGRAAAAPPEPEPEPEPERDWEAILPSQEERQEIYRRLGYL